jgi:cyclopropane-fatty-acyl-phospholipid synthase
MNSATLSQKQTHDSNRKVGFYERLVMGTLKRFKVGHLQMTLPDGSVQHLGDASSPVTAEVRVNHWGFFRQCALFGNVGFGEAYVDGEWETDNIAAVISWFIQNIAANQGSQASSTRLAGTNLLKAYISL